jgi:hypothetical protein
LKGGLLELREESEKRALLAQGECGVHDVTLPGVHGRQQLVDDGSGGWCYVDEELAAILRMWQPTYEVSLLEVVEQ